MLNNEKKQTALVPSDIQKKAFVAASDHLKVTYNLRVEDQVTASGITRGRFLRIRNSDLIPSAEDLNAMRGAFAEFDEIYSEFVDKYIQEQSGVSAAAIMEALLRIERRLDSLDKKQS